VCLHQLHYHPLQPPCQLNQVPGPASPTATTQPTSRAQQRHPPHVCSALCAFTPHPPPVDDGARGSASKHPFFWPGSSPHHVSLPTQPPGLPLGHAHSPTGAGRGTDAAHSARRFGAASRGVSPTRTAPTPTAPATLKWSTPRAATPPKICVRRRMRTSSRTATGTITSCSRAPRTLTRRRSVLAAAELWPGECTARPPRTRHHLAMADAWVGRGVLAALIARRTISG
jgi:hypothetical protein